MDGCFGSVTKPLCLNEKNVKALSPDLQKSHFHRSVTLCTYNAVAMRTLVIVLAVLLSCAPVPAQTAPTLANVRKVYIEKMDNNLDQYLTSSISSKFHGSMTVVLEKSQADAILRGENMGAQNTTKGTVELVDPSGKVVLWSGTASDRSGKFLDLKHGGEQKIADHLIGKLKKAMQPR